MACECGGSPREAALAGDWLKMELATPEKLEVFAITQKMGWTDPDLTIGKLFRFWRWWDQQTEDGNAPSVTDTALFDALCNAPGFGKALIDVGWLVINGNGAHLPNFSRHNGKTAKRRALTAKRVADHRESKAKEKRQNVTNVTPLFSNSNARRVTDVTLSASPREEKRRILHGKSREDLNSSDSGKKTIQQVPCKKCHDKGTYTHRGHPGEEIYCECPAGKRLSQNEKPLRR